jgi:hypothetical protein
MLIWGEETKMNSDQAMGWYDTLTGYIERLAEMSDDPGISWDVTAEDTTAGWLVSVTVGNRARCCRTQAECQELYFFMQMFGSLVIGELD